MARHGDLHLQSAQAVVEMLRTGKVTPLELIDIVEARVAATEPLVHATPITCFERARKAAAQLVHPADPPPGYLYGLPILIKDTSPVAGVRWTLGFSQFKNRIARDSDALVLQLEAMGALVVGKTNMPEFGVGSHTFNSIFPTTVSPYDTRSSAGGSSGGSAAALAACQCWLATGSDLGGSLRTPAAFCGVLGFRLSPGRTPTSDPTEPQHGLHVVNGPMARSVGDLALFLDAMAPQGGPGWKGLETLPPLGAASWQALASRGAGGMHGLRVVYSTLGTPVAQPVDALCRAAAERLGTLRMVDEPFDLGRAARAADVLRAEKLAQSLGSARASLKPETVYNIDCVGAFPSEAPAWVAAARLNALELAREVRALFDSAEVLATPAVLDGAFAAELRYPSGSYGSLPQGRGFGDYLEWMRPAVLISITSCPALVLPVGLLPDGRPVGLQLVAARGADGLLVEAAAALEAALGGAFARGCPEPRRGSGPLEAVGPRTAEEAAQHHGPALEAFRRRCGGPRSAL